LRKNEENNVDKSTFVNNLLNFIDNFTSKIDILLDKFKDIDVIRFLNLFSILILITSLSKFILQTIVQESILLSSDTFNINFEVSNRLIFVLSFIFILTLLKINFVNINQKKIALTENKWYVNIVCILIYCIYLKYCNDLLFRNNKQISNHLFTILIAILWLLRSSIEIFENKIGIFKKITNNAALITITLVAILFPIFDTHYINEESVVNNEIYLANNRIDESSGYSLNDFYSALLNPSAGKNFKGLTIEIKDLSKIASNLIILDSKKAGITNEVNSVLFPTVIQGKDYDVIVTRFDGHHINNICFFVIDRFYSSCINDLNTLKGLDILSFINVNVRQEYRESVKNGIEKIIERELLLKEMASLFNLSNKNLKPLISGMNSGVRGIYFHHYHAFIEKGFDFNFSRLISNQYGLGALLYIKFIQDIFDFKIYDSVVISVIITNIYIFAFILCLSYYIKNRNITTNPQLLIFGFLVYISYVYFSVKLEAPSLYGIRFLPHITLILLAIIPIQIERISKIYALSLYFLFILAVFYNFEYGVLLGLSATIAALSIKRFKYIILFLLPIIGYLLIKYSYTANDSTNNLFYYYISGIGFNTGTNLEFKIISVIFLLFMILFNSVNLKNPTKNFFITAIFYFFCFSLLKGFWSNEQYQLASSFFFLFVYLYALDVAGIKTVNFGAIKLNTKKITLSISIISILLMVGPIDKYFKFLYDNNLQILYEKNVMSDYWLTDKKIKDKINEISKLDTENQASLAIISPSDSTYSLFFEKPIVSPFSDLSTFLVNKADVMAAMRNYEDNKVPYIIIDRYLLDDPNSFIPYENKYTSKYISSNILNYKFQRHLIDLARSMIDNSQYKVCDQSLHYIKICRK
jgi:hypothetical protein